MNGKKLLSLVLAVALLLTCTVSCAPNADDETPKDTLFEEVDPTCEHTFGDWVEITKATCIAEGRKERSCTVCGSKEIQLFDKTAHTEEIIPEIPATSDSEGYTEGRYCTVCGEQLVQPQPIPVLSAGNSTSSTASTTGKTTSTTQDVLKDTILDEVDPACKHAFQAWVEITKATCLTEGKKERSCKTCGTKETQIFEKTDHKTETIPEVPVTCSTDGYTKGSRCTVCEKQLVQPQRIPAVSGTNHVFSVQRTEANLYTGGEITEVCSYCQYSIVKTQDPLPPSSAGVPIVYLKGSIEGVSKKQTVNVAVTYQSSNVNFDAYATLKVQGNTSANYDKKNFTIKFYEDAQMTKKHKVDLCGWGKEFQYCLKANYIDYSQSRNIVNARLYAAIRKTRSSRDPVFDTLPNMGMIDGYPVAVYLNGEFYGFYTMNIPKDKWLFDMSDDETKKEAILLADDWQPSAYLNEPIAYDFSNGWDLEHCSTQDTTWVVDSFNQFIDFVRRNNGASLKAGLPEYIDVDSFIDTMLFSITINAYDNYVKNTLYVTYDGGDTWICSPYDLDSTWGLFWDGTYYLDPNHALLSKSNNGTVQINSGVNILWPKLFAIYKTEIKARYNELRSGILSNDNIKAEFNKFFDSVPEVLRQSELARWPDVPNNHVDQKQQIFTYIDDRLWLLDQFFRNY